MVEAIIIDTLATIPNGLAGGEAWSVGNWWANPRPSKLQHCWGQREYLEESWRREETFYHSDSRDRVFVDASMKNSQVCFTQPRHHRYQVAQYAELCTVKYVVTQTLHHVQNVTQGQFIRVALLSHVWIFSNPSLWSSYGTRSIYKQSSVLSSFYSPKPSSMCKVNL